MDASTDGKLRLSDWVVLGLGAGAWLGLADFGSGWLWLSTWPDRIALLVRALLLMAPLGALLGAVGFCASQLATAVAARVPQLKRPGLADLPYVVLASPGLAAVAHLLFTGGRMSKLALRPVLVVGAFVVLAVAVFGALGVVRALRALAARSARGAKLAVAALAAGFFAAAKLNQHVLPQLYEYLHVSLTCAAFVCAATAVHLARTHLVAGPRVLRTTGHALAGLAAAVFVLVLNLATFDRTPNVRVAMHEPHTPHARTAMRGVAPLLRVLTPARQPVRHAPVAPAPGSRAVGGAPLVTLGEAHVLLLTVDALRADHLGAYGYGRGLSPRLDALAADSVVFERAYAAAPHSSYSLSSLMTSEYLHEVVELDVPLPTVTLPRAFGSRGYLTSTSFTLGIFHTEGERLTAYRDDAFGFERHVHGTPRAEAQTDWLLSELRRIASEGEPTSFVWGHYFDTHEPYLDTSLGRSDMDRYDAEIRNVDRAIGRLLDTLETVLDKPVVVVVTADHGEEFHEHGGVYHGSTLYDEQIRVPLIIHAEGLAARRVREPVSLVDVAPTLLALVGIEPASTMRGQDLRPAMTGVGRRQGPAHAAVTHKRMAVDDRYKLVADLRFDLYELYDLEHDPGERHNLASAEPERVASMRGDIYAWLDGIRENARRVRGAWESALDLGRLRDRRALEPLALLVRSAEAPVPARVEAAMILGRFADPRGKPALIEAMRGPEPLVAAEAAISLGRMFDPVAKDALRDLVRSEDPGIRSRAAISLARLGDRGAVEALLETLRTSRDQFEREESVRWLGRLGDAAAAETLVDLIGDFRIRHLTVVAIGQIRDKRSLPTLLDALEWETHASVRNNIVRGLGELGAHEAIAALSTLAREEPELDYAVESLLRTGALARGAVYGLDFDVRAGRRLRALRACSDATPDHAWLYVGKSACELHGDSLQFTSSTPRRLPPGGVFVGALRGKALAAEGSELVLSFGGHEVPVRFDGTSREVRFEVPASALRPGSMQVRLVRRGAPVSLDYFVLLPSP